MVLKDAFCIFKAISKDGQILLNVLIVRIYRIHQPATRIINFDFHNIYDELSLNLPSICCVLITDFYYQNDVFIPILFYRFRCFVFLKMTNETFGLLARG